MKDYVIIYSELDGKKIERKAFTQTEAFLIIGQLHKEGCFNFHCDFSDLDNLPKGVQLR